MIELLAIYANARSCHLTTHYWLINTSNCWERDGLILPLIKHINIWGHWCG